MGNRPARQVQISPALEALTVEYNAIHQGDCSQLYVYVRVIERMLPKYKELLDSYGGNICRILELVKFMDSKIKDLLTHCCYGKDVLKYKAIIQRCKLLIPPHMETRAYKLRLRTVIRHCDANRYTAFEWICALQGLLSKETNEICSYLKIVAIPLFRNKKFLVGDTIVIKTILQLLKVCAIMADRSNTVIAREDNYLQREDFYMDEDCPIFKLSICETLIEDMREIEFRLTYNKCVYEFEELTYNILLQELRDNIYLYEHATTEKMTVFAVERINFVMQTMKLSCPDMTAEQRQRLGKSLMRVRIPAK